jgi:hypothetical protein
VRGIRVPSGAALCWRKAQQEHPNPLSEKEVEREGEGEGEVEVEGEREARTVGATDGLAHWWWFHLPEKCKRNKCN